MKRYLLWLSMGLLLLQAPAFAEQAGGEPQTAAASAIRGDTGQAAEAWNRIEAGALLIDVRSAEEFESGHIEGAINVPHSDIDGLVAAIGDDPTRPVVLYCGSGRRAGMAQQQLESLGYQGVFNGTGLTALEATRP